MGGHIGTIIGALGWVIGFAIVCVISGNTATLARFIVPAVAVSLGLAFFLILITELAMKRFGRGYKFSIALYGALSWVIGLLLLLLNHWIAPIINNSPRMAHTMRDMNAVYRTDDTWAILLLVAGTIMLGVFTYFVIRDFE